MRASLLFRPLHRLNIKELYCERVALDGCPVDGVGLAYPIFCIREIVSVARRVTNDYLCGLDSGPAPGYALGIREMSLSASHYSALKRKNGHTVTQ